MLVISVEILDTLFNVVKLLNVTRNVLLNIVSISMKIKRDCYDLITKLTPVIVHCKPLKEGR